MPAACGDRGLRAASAVPVVAGRAWVELPRRVDPPAEPEGSMLSDVAMKLKGWIEDPYLRAAAVVLVSMGFARKRS